APTQSTPGIFDRPSDDPDGGQIAFDFPRLVQPLALDLADIDPEPQHGASVTLLDDANRTRIYSVAPGWPGPFGAASKRTLDPTPLLPQQGNGTRFAFASEMPGFDPARVVRIEVELFDGGAIDNLVYDPYP